MTVVSDERRILDMLAAGQITVDEATELLDALKRDEPTPPKAPKHSKASKGIARTIRIRVDAQEEDGSRKAKVDVNVPLGLAKFASKFLPDDAKVHLEKRGVNLKELFEAVDGDFPEGQVIHIDGSQDGSNHNSKITIEVT